MSTPRKTGSQQPVRRGRIARVVSAIGTAALVGSIAALAACSDAPSGPAVTPSYAKIGDVTKTTTVNLLLRDTPLPNSISKSFVVKRSGGTFDWAEVGLKFKVPSDAFTAATMTITVTALAGDVVAYDFGPDGSEFAQPLVIEQDLKLTNFYKLPLGIALRGAYFKNPTQIDDATNTGQASAFQPTVMDVSNSKLSFTVTHFSGYMVSMD